MSTAPGPRRRLRLRIRERLVLLVLATITPFLLYTAWHTRARLAERRDASVVRARDAANQVAARLDDRIASVRTLLVAMAQTARPDPRDAVANDTLLGGIIRMLPPGFANLGVFDASGNNIGSSVRPIGDRTRFTAAGRRYIIDAVRLRRFAIGDPVRSRIDTTRMAVGMAMPILGRDSSVRALVVAAIPLSWLASVLTLPALPAGSVVTVVNDRGLVIGRSDSSALYLGKDMSAHPLIRAALAGDLPTRDVAGFDQVERLYVAVNTGASTWHVIVGTPTTVALAPARDELRVELALSLLTLALALVVATLMGRRIVLPVRALSVDAEVIASGDLRHRSQVQSSSEIGTLAEAFNRMAAALERNSTELRASEQRYRALFNLSPLPMWITDFEDLRFLAVNDAAVRHYGWSREEFLRMTLRDVRPPSELVRFERSLGTVDEHELYTGLWRHHTRNGPEIDVEVTVRAIEFEGRGARLSVNHDVTNRLAAERALDVSREQLRQAQKMEAIGRFAGGIAHDFNNILTGILGYCDLALDDIGEMGGARPEIVEIRRAAERAASLTQQILAFGRRQVLQPVSLSLNDVVERMSGMLARVIGEHIRVVQIRVPELWTVEADQTQVEQVVLNLALNARDAMPDGGALTIETANVTVEADSTEHAGVPAGDYAVLSVVDTGVGMGADVQARIFEPFFTTKAIGKGTGLGLATAYGIVQQSKGWMRVWSEPGRGSIFSVYLPRAAAAAPAPPAVVPRWIEPARGAVILLAEDERAVRRVACDALTRLGYVVLPAEDGPAALEAAAQHEGTIDLLLTDVVMPGMDGAELARRVRETRPDIRVLYSSGYTDDAIVREGVLLDGLAFLPKPFTPAQLAQRVRDVLGAAPAGQAQGRDPDARG